MTTPSSASIGTLYDSPKATLTWYGVGLLYWFLWASKISALRDVRRAHSPVEMWEADPVLSVCLLLTLLIATLGVRVNLSTQSIGRSGGRGLRSFVRGFFIGLVVCLPVAIGFVLASSVYPVPPRDAGVWQASLVRFWMPPEVIGLTSGKTVIGYPLGEKDGWQALLIDHDRTIRYLRPDEIKSRTVYWLDAPPRSTPFWGSSDYVPSSYAPCYPAPPTKQRRQLRRDVLLPERPAVAATDELQDRGRTLFDGSDALRDRGSTLFDTVPDVPMARIGR